MKLDLNNMRKNLIFIGVVALLIVAGSLWNDEKFHFLSNVKCQWSNVDCPWYAVYLTNNQVYFGHIASKNNDTILLEDVHFAEAYQEPAVVAKSEKFALTQAPKQTFRISQRGNEKMLASDHKLFINRPAVLYWEKFSPNAEVVKLLEEKQGGI